MRRRFVVLGVAAVVLALALTVLATSRGSSSWARVHGRVLRGGAPVAGAFVHAILTPGASGGEVRGVRWIYPTEWETTTDADGRYEFRVRTDGMVMLTAFQAGVRGDGGIGFELAPGADEEMDLHISVPIAPPAPKPTPR